MNGRQNMKMDSLRVLGWRRVLKENRKLKSTKKYNRYIHIYRRLIENVGTEECHVPIKDIKY